MKATSLLAAGLLLSGLTPTASAGDMASLDILGYSRDGSVFAFEEFGVFDGSGGAYSNIYFIDIKADRFLPGTPIRATLNRTICVTTFSPTDLVGSLRRFWLRPGRHTRSRQFRAWAVPV